MDSIPAEWLNLNQVVSLGFPTVHNNVKRAFSCHNTFDDPFDPPKFWVLEDLTVVSAFSAPPDAIENYQQIYAAVGSKLQLRDQADQKKLVDAIGHLQRNPRLGRAFVRLTDAEISRSVYLVLTRSPEVKIAERLQADATAGRSRFIVTVCDLSADIPLSAESLVQFLDLTFMEAQLCIALLKEQSLQEFADKFDVSISTARWHWGNIREKLDVHSQLGLVRMLMRLAKP